jgi:hypothetical protein
VMRWIRDGLNKKTLPTTVRHRCMHIASN